MIGSSSSPSPSPALEGMNVRDTSTDPSFTATDCIRKGIVPPGPAPVARPACILRLCSARAMEIAGCFVGQIKAAWLVGKSGILVWMVVASIATQANDRTARDREIIMVSRLLSVSLSRSVAGWSLAGPGRSVSRSSGFSIDFLILSFHILMTILLVVLLASPCLFEWYLLISY